MSNEVYISTNTDSFERVDLECRETEMEVKIKLKEKVRRINFLHVISFIRIKAFSRTLMESSTPEALTRRSASRVSATLRRRRTS